MEPETESASATPAWFVTFADMMTLLLTFFIMLASMSELKTEKLYQSMAQSMRRKFGSEAELVSLVSDGAGGDANLQGLASVSRTRRADLMRGAKSSGGSSATMQPTVAERRLDGGVVSFADGVSDLSATDRRGLLALAEKLRTGHETLEVRGHTSQRPLDPQSPYRDRWDLAYARCRKTMELLIAAGIDPRRIRIGVTPASEASTRAAKPTPGRDHDNPERARSGVELWIVAERAAPLASSTATPTVRSPARR